MSFVLFKYNEISNYLQSIKSEYLGFYSSSFLHLLILLFVVGIPNLFQTKPILVPTIIPIEIVNVSDFTSLQEDFKEIKSADVKKTEVKNSKFNSSNNQDIKKIKIKDKPKPILEDVKIENNIMPKENINIKEKIDMTPALEKEEIRLNNNNYERLPIKEIKPKLKPNLKIENQQKTKKSDMVIEPQSKSKPVPQSKPKPVPQSKPKPVPQSKPKPDFDDQLASMLKDLRNEKSNLKINEDKIQNKKEQEVLTEETEKELNEKAQLSISEIDLVLQQLSRCFVSPAGAEIEKKWYVKISAKIQRNRRVYEDSIRIIDTNIPQSSSVYGPITESAMRTLLNPECIPLKLPEDKYDLWKNLTMKFDYSVMRGN